MFFKRKHLIAQKWVYDAQFTFPEWEQANLEEKKQIGLAFSGGGNRSASLTTGYLRGLKHLNLLDRFGYLSCVSGSSWSSVPYTYLNSSINDDDFLGIYEAPEDLTYSKVLESHEHSMLSAIAKSKIFDDLLSNIFAGDELFSRIVGNTYLKPFLIGDRTKFFSYDQNKVQEIIDRNLVYHEKEEFKSKGIYKYDHSDFYTVNPNGNRPYLIVGGILIRSDILEISRYPFEMTPLYVGIPTFFPNAGSMSKYHIGGGYVEPFGFDTDSPNEDNMFDELKPNFVSLRIRRKKHIFSLSDVIGTSGAAPAEYLDRIKIDIGFPEFKYWSPQEPDKAKEYDFADGGILDNTGIMPLLRRKVKKIIVFVNGLGTLDNEGDVSKMIQPLFMVSPNQFGLRNFALNIVLSEEGIDPLESYHELIQEFIQLNGQGQPVVVRKNYVTVNNHHHSIPAGQKVEILWIYNAFAREWVDRINDIELRSFVLSEKEEKNFPNYDTFFTNFPKIIDIRPEQANIMAHLASYVMVSHEREILNFINEDHIA